MSLAQEDDGMCSDFSVVVSLHCLPLFLYTGMGTSDTVSLFHKELILPFITRVWVEICLEQSLMQQRHQ